MLCVVRKWQHDHHINNCALELNPQCSRLCFLEVLQNWPHIQPLFCCLVVAFFADQTTICYLLVCAWTSVQVHFVFSKFYLLYFKIFIMQTRKIVFIIVSFQIINSLFRLKIQIMPIFAQELHRFFHVLCVLIWKKKCFAFYSDAYFYVEEQKNSIKGKREENKLALTMSFMSVADSEL